jgi:hypothetical protein
VTDAEQLDHLAANVAGDTRRPAGLVNDAGASARRGLAEPAPGPSRRLIEKPDRSVRRYPRNRLSARRSGELDREQHSLRLRDDRLLLARRPPGQMAARRIEQVRGRRVGRRRGPPELGAPRVGDPALLGRAEPLITSTLWIAAAGRAALPEEGAQVGGFLPSNAAECIGGAEFVIDRAPTSTGLCNRIKGGAPRKSPTREARQT